MAIKHFRRWAAIVALLIVILAFLPPVRTRVRAGSALGEALGLSVPRPFAPDVTPEATQIGGVNGRIYQTKVTDRAVLIVPGVTPAGVGDERVNQVAVGLARSRRTVFIPELDLYREQFTEDDLVRIVTSIVTLAERSSAGVTVFGASYGGSFALVAAADPRVEGSLSRVATLGAYFDLTGVIQAVTTGVSLVDGRTIPWEAHPLARDILYARATELLPEADRNALIDALGVGNPESLSPPARAVYELLVNTDPERTYPLAVRLPVEVRAFLDRFSPVSVVDGIGVPVAAMHSVDDPVVPYGELLRLQEGMPDARISTVDLFEHVDFDPTSLTEWIEAAPDLRRLWDLTTWLLSG